MADARVDGALAVIAVPLNRRLVWEALQAAGASVDFVDGQYLPEGNKPLAGIGDRVLALIVADNARDDGLRIGRLTSSKKRAGMSDHNAGQTSQRVQTIGNNGTLASLCDSAGLTPFINRNPSDLYIAPSTKAATVEAVVGAAYKHDGIICAAQVMRNLNII